VSDQVKKKERTAKQSKKANVLPKSSNSFGWKKESFIGSCRHPFVEERGGRARGLRRASALPFGLGGAPS